MADVQNITELIDDPLAEGSLKNFYKQMQQTYVVLEFMGYFTDTVRIMLSLLVIAADILIIVIMKKTSKLKTKTDVLIMHYAIWNIVFESPFNVIYELIHILGGFRYIPFVFFQILFEMGRLGLLLTFFFALSLGIEWLFNINSSNLGERFSILNKYLLYITYLLGFLSILPSLLIWFTNYYWRIEYFVVKTIYYSILLFISFLNWLERKNKSTLGKQQSYALTVASIIIFLWLPQNIYDSLLSWTHGHYILYSILLCTIFLAEWSYISTPIVVVIMLIKLNKYFEIGFWQLFKKRTKQYNGDTENLNEENSDEENDQNSGIIQSSEVYL